MKTCGWCGNKYPDEAEVCSVDGKPLESIGEGTSVQSNSPSVEGEAEAVAREDSFWEQMNFRQFAALILRVQALWLLFYAVLEAINFLPYFRAVAGDFQFSDMPSGLKFDMFLQVLRIVLYVAGAIAVIQNAERLLSWLVKDWIKKQSHEDSSATPPS